MKAHRRWQGARNIRWNSFLFRNSECYNRAIEWCQFQLVYWCTHKTTFEFGGHAISAGISWNIVKSSPKGTLTTKNHFGTEMASLDLFALSKFKILPAKFKHSFVCAVLMTHSKNCLGVKFKIWSWCPVPQSCQLRRRTMACHFPNCQWCNCDTLYPAQCSNPEVKTKKLHDKSEAAMRTPSQRASNQAPHDVAGPEPSDPYGPITLSLWP